MAELAFSGLEAKAELAFEHLMQKISSFQKRTKAMAMQIDRHELETLRRFFVFLRYRNSAQYGLTLCDLLSKATSENITSDDGALISIWLRIHHTLTNIHTFLRHDSAQSSTPVIAVDDITRPCWNLSGAETCLGIASEGQEFVLTDGCIGNLDESFRGDP